MAYERPRPTAEVPAAERMPEKIQSISGVKKTEDRFLIAWKRNRANAIKKNTNVQEGLKKNPTQFLNEGISVDHQLSAVRTKLFSNTKNHGR